MNPAPPDWLNQKTSDSETAGYDVIRRILSIDKESQQIKSEIASLIDHTNLRPDTTPADIITLCREARVHKFAGVCVHTSYISLCADELSGTDTGVFSVAGFPYGANATRSKIHDAIVAREAGATELDMVLHIGWLKNGDFDYVENDIAEVVRAAEGLPVKVILENGLLTNQEKIDACNIARDAGARYVKTSTGFGFGGATVDDVSLMRQTVGLDLGVKAAGGIRTFSEAMEMIRAGASRIGTSSGVRIISGE